MVRKLTSNDVKQIEQNDNGNGQADKPEKKVPRLLELRSCSMLSGGNLAPRWFLFQSPSASVSETQCHSWRGTKLPRPALIKTTPETPVVLVEQAMRFPHLKRRFGNELDNLFSRIGRGGHGHSLVFSVCVEVDPEMFPAVNTVSK